MIGLEKPCVFCGMMFTIETEGHKGICRRCINADEELKVTE